MLLCNNLVCLYVTKCFFPQPNYSNYVRFGHIYFFRINRMWLGKCSLCYFLPSLPKCVFAWSPKFMMVGRFNLCKIIPWAKFLKCHYRPKGSMVYTDKSKDIKMVIRTFLFLAAEIPCTLGSSRTTREDRNGRKFLMNKI